MENKAKYQELISDVISKQSDILGPEIAILKARSVSELTIDDKGKVTNIEGDPRQVLQKLIDTYVALSGQIVKNALGSLFEKYPDIEKIG
jgi:hypothetical protein